MTCMHVYCLVFCLNCPTTMNWHELSLLYASYTLISIVYKKASFASTWIKVLCMLSAKLAYSMLNRLACDYLPRCCMSKNQKSKDPDWNMCFYRVGYHSFVQLYCQGLVESKSTFRSLQWPKLSPSNQKHNSSFDQCKSNDKVQVYLVQ